jgi:hypothetical protein
MDSRRATASCTSLADTIIKLVRLCKIDAAVNDFSGNRRLKTGAPECMIVHRHPIVAGHLSNEMHLYDPDSMTFHALDSVISGSPPSPGSGSRFTSAGGKLYVFTEGDSCGLCV